MVVAQRRYYHPDVVPTLDQPLSFAVWAVKYLQFPQASRPIIPEEEHHCVFHML